MEFEILFQFFCRQISRKCQACKLSLVVYIIINSFGYLTREGIIVKFCNKICNDSKDLATLYNSLLRINGHELSTYRKIILKLLTPPYSTPTL